MSALFQTASWEQLRVEGAQPRPYQRAALDAWSAHVDAGGLRGIIVHATGTGKNLFFIFSVVERQARTLYIAHREELLKQPERRIRALVDGVDIGRVQAERDEVDAKHVVFASVQTITMDQRLARLLESHRRDPFRQIVCDEAHHAAAKTYLKVLDHPELAKVPALALTATGERHDEKGLAKIWGPRPLHYYPYNQAIAEGYLVPFVSERIIIPDFNLSEAMLKASNDAELVVEQERVHFAEHVADGTEQALAAGRKRGVVFTTTIDQAQRVADILTGRGIPSACVSGEMSARLRESRLLDHSMGSLKVLCNADLLNEGYDDAGIDFIGMASPTASFVKFYQRAGRGFRPFPGKLNCLIQDYVGVVDVHDLMTARDLLDLDEGGGKKKGDRPFEPSCARSGCLHRQRRHHRGRGKCRADGCACIGWIGPGEGDRLSALAKASKHGANARHAPKALARAKWLPIMDGVIAMAAGEQGAIILRCEEDGGWRGYRLPRDAWNVGELRPLTRRALDLSLASGVMEDYARRIGVFGLSNEAARWRDADVTTGQIDLLDRIGVGIPLERGAASDAIETARVKRIFEKQHMLEAALAPRVKR